jgi:hypothetical protein
VVQEQWRNSGEEGFRELEREIERVAEEVGRQVEQWLSAAQEQILHTVHPVAPAAQLQLSSTM